jgi:uncharacterized caspase-like protein
MLSQILLFTKALLILTSAPSAAEIDLSDLRSNSCTEIHARSSSPLASDTINSGSSRVALVIGNADYVGRIPSLDNPRNDAVAVTKTLTRLNFRVFLAVDATAATTRQCYEKMKDAVETDGIGLIYYSGHGIQIDDQNFLVPIDAKPDRNTDSYIFIDDLMQGLEEKAGTLLVFLDACRNNPFAQDGIEGLSASTGKGLMTVSTNVLKSESAARKQAKGIFVAYSTSPNATALDGEGDLSPFTTAFVRHIGEPGFSVQRALSAVSRDVGDATDWAQTPWIKSSLTAEIMLNGNVTLEDAKSYSKEQASRSTAFLMKGDVSAAIMAALKGIPKILDDNAKANFPEALAALESAARSDSVMLPVEDPKWSPRAYSRIANRMVGHVYGPGEHSVDLWDTRNRTFVASIAKFSGSDPQARFSPDGKLVTTNSADGNVIIVADAKTGQLVRQFTLNRTSTVVHLGFSPAGSAIVIDAMTRHPPYRASTEIWDAKLGKRLHKVPTNLICEGLVPPENGSWYDVSSVVNPDLTELSFACVTFNPNKKRHLVFGKYDIAAGTVISSGSIDIGALIIGPPIGTRDGNMLIVLAYYPDYTQLVLDTKNGVVIGKPILGNNASFSPDGSLFSVLDGKILKVFESRTAKLVRVLGGDTPAEFVVPGFARLNSEKMTGYEPIDEAWSVMPAGEQLRLLAISRLPDGLRAEADSAALTFDPAGFQR